MCKTWTKVGKKIERGYWWFQMNQKLFTVPLSQFSIGEEHWVDKNLVLERKTFYTDQVDRPSEARPRGLKRHKLGLNKISNRMNISVTPHLKMFHVQRPKPQKRARFTPNYIKGLMEALALMEVAVGNGMLLVVVVNIGTGCEKDVTWAFTINQAPAEKRRDRWVSVRPWWKETISAVVAAAAATYPGNAPSPGVPARSILEGHLGPAAVRSPAARHYIWYGGLSCICARRITPNPHNPTSEHQVDGGCLSFLVLWRVLQTKWSAALFFKLYKQF